MDENRQNRKMSLRNKLVMGLVVLTMIAGVLVPLKFGLKNDFLIRTKIVLAQENWDPADDFLTSVSPTGMPVRDFGATIQKAMSDVKNWISKKIVDRLKTLSAVAYRNAIKNFLSQIAYKTASNLASGMTGQKPAFETNLWEMIKEEGDGALGDYLNKTMGKLWGKDLCAPLDPLAKVKVEVAVRGLFDPGANKARCKFTTIQANFEALGKMELTDLVDFSAKFDPSGNQIGAVLVLQSGAEQARLGARESAQFTKLIEGQFKSLRDLITGEVKTPASVYQGVASNAIDTSAQAYLTYTGDALADGIGVFTNTLTSKLINYYLNKGLYQSRPSGAGGSGGVYGFTGGGAQAAKERFADLAQPDYNFAGPVDVLNNLSCGSENQFSCTIDNELKTALEQGEHLTVRQAIDKGFLYGNRPFGYRVDDKSGGTDDIEKNIYSHRTLVVWRKYRIIPVGWELAAEYFGKYDRTGEQITLNKLIDYYDVKESPYYRLVDPAWVLKAPMTICEKEGPGELTSGETIDISIDLDQDGEISDQERREVVIRLDQCADEKSCIKESSDGQNCEYYGYCTEEKPIWRIDGDPCDAIYNSCQSYTDREGKQVAYLKNTLGGRDVCNADNVGCRAYCPELNKGEWDCVADGDNLWYLNNNAKECRAEQAGCDEFIRLGEIGGDLDSLDVSTLDYDNFTKISLQNPFICDKDNVGCRLYTPVSYKGVGIPAVIESDDVCPAECVGYKSYLELDSFFDIGDGVLDFIAATAQTCSASEMGCSEFTNLTEGEAGERKEYFSAVRACISPDDNNTDIKNYYSWASTAESGNQLKSWRLLKSNLGNYPCTNTTTDPNGKVDCSDASEGAHLCTVGATEAEDNPEINPDCTEFTDESGQSEWVKLSKVVFESDDCATYRRTQDKNIYSFIAGLSQSCRAAAAGCRAYKGSAANNIKILFNNDFENGTKQGWEVTNLTDALSNESLNSAGHSLLIPASARKDVKGLITNNKTYKLSFWAKGKAVAQPATINAISFWDEENNITTKFDIGGTITVSDWVKKEVILKDENFTRDISSKEWLRIDVKNGIFFDNIVLTEVTDNLFLIKDSWETPEICVVENALGCEQYRDNNKDDWYLKDFSKLCYDEMIGCEAMVRTYNSDNKEEEVYDRAEPTDKGLVVKADEIDYVVYDRDKANCEVGCTALGEANYEQTGDIYFTNSYLIIEPDDFSKIDSPLCLSKEEGCDRFMNSEKGGGLAYFKDPGEMVCEYKKDSSGRYGWYLTGDSGIACPGNTEGYCLGGRSTIDLSTGNTCKSDSDCISFAKGGKCSSYTGLCPTSMSTCSEYQDPVNPEGCDRTFINGQIDSSDNSKKSCDFYYYKANSIDTACTEINEADGCFGFHVIEGGDNIYYSQARCAKALDQICEIDDDCVDEDGNSLGKCQHQFP